MNLRPPSDPVLAGSIARWWPPEWPRLNPDWIPSDIELLKEWRRLRISVWGISAALGRTEDDVEAKMKELGL